MMLYLSQTQYTLGCLSEEIQQSALCKNPIKHGLNYACLLHVDSIGAVFHAELAHVGFSHSVWKC